MRSQRGTLTEPGQNSPDRYRSIDENLDLFRRMRAGEFPNGARVLRAKIDMASPNMNLRDPVLYRILHAEHPRTGNAWCIYPTYDYAHGQSDAIEGITHSLCTLEFEDHRPLYDWLIDNLPVPSRPHQYEFARLNIAYTVMSKRILTRLVSEGHVTGWDDPRMPTLAGVRRRGIPAAALRDFVRRGGITKANSVTEFAAFEYSIRELLNRIAPRRMAVLRPLKLVIENWPEGRTETLEAINNPEDPAAGIRPITFGRELYIERDDFMEDPPKKFFRLAPGREVRLRYGYFVTCRDVVKNVAGEVVELRCTYDPATRGGNCTARRTQGAGDAALGGGGGCDRRRRCACSTTCSRDPIRARTATSWPTSIRTRSRCCAAVCWSRRLPQRRSARRSSSSGSAISAPIPTRHRASRCSTAPSDCATPGRRCRGRKCREGEDNSMHFGAAMFFTDASMTPGELGPLLEQRGFELLWVPEHSHVPLVRTKAFPGGPELPRPYYDIMDPFLVLTAAAVATKTLKVGTGVCLINQRDPIQTAKLVASLDQLSGGRFLFGVGNGWNKEEMEHHGTNFETRHKLSRERIEAMRAIWSRDTAEYHGEFVNFAPMQTWPKPVQQPFPVIVGGAFPYGARRAVRYGDGWIPGAGTTRHGDIAATLPQFHTMAREAGRDPAALPVTLFRVAEDLELLQQYRDLGIARVVISLPAAKRDAILPILDRWAPLMRAASA